MFILSNYFQKPIWYSEWFENILNELLLNYCFYKDIKLEKLEKLERLERLEKIKKLEKINNDVGYNIDMETDIVLYDMRKTPSFEMTNRLHHYN